MWALSWRSAGLVLVACSVARGQWSPPAQGHEVFPGEVFIDPGPYGAPTSLDAFGTSGLPAQSLPVLPEHFPEPIPPYAEVVPPPWTAAEAPPPGTRSGVFQKLQFSGTWIPEGELTWSDLDAWVVLGFPFPKRETPLVVTPGFAVRYLDGPPNPELPPRLYDAWVEWRHLRQLTEIWAMDVSVTTGYYSDFEADDGDAFRITGRGVAVYTWSPVTKIVLGAGYFNRAAAQILPVGGLLVTPNESTRYELIFPSPRLAWRLDHLSVPEVDEQWFYIAGEFGGGVWAFRRVDGSSERLDYTDLRILLGIEHKRPGTIGSRWEIGYVFGREIEFDSATPNFEPEDALLLRVAVTY